MNSVIFAFTLTVGAGLSTGIGSLIALLAKKTNTRFLSLALGFSAGVMIYVSMVEIIVKARESLTSVLGATGGAWAAAGSFFALKQYKKAPAFWLTGAELFICFLE